MARLNLTIPDALYERWERLRDRVNVSKVCAVALAKELDMVEGMTASENDTKVQRLISRFLRERETQQRWYLRGRQDGESWAMERASLEELRMMEEWDEGSINDCTGLDEIDPDEYPSFDGKARLKKWQQADNDSSDHPEPSPDWRAYLRGWYHGARDLWNAAKPALT